MPAETLGDDFCSTPVKTENVEKSVIGPVRGLTLGMAAEKGRDKPGPADCKSEKRRVKAVSFWARKQAGRKLPGHCSGCGALWPGPSKQCDRCHEKGQRRRDGLKAVPAVVAYPMLRDALKRIGILEHRLTVLCLKSRVAYKAGYDKGFRRGRGQRARNHEGLRGEHSEHRANCKTSLEELQTLSHRYERTGT